MSKAKYAQRRIGELTGVRAPVFNSFHFKEFTVKFQEKTITEINQKLNANGLEAGISLSNDFPELEETALYCVTEVHTKNDIDNLVSILRMALEE
jgi:glycine dehydrogenase subunit 1